MAHDGLIISIIFTLTDKEHLQRILSNPHSMHDGYSLSCLTLLPVFFLLRGAVDSFPAGG
jgi:hypothetical protein